MNEPGEHLPEPDAGHSGQDVVPFESATELRNAHEALLVRLDEQLPADSSEQAELDALSLLAAPIRTFLARGAATGVFLEEVKDRTACQILLDYWVSTLARVGHGARQPRLARFDRERLPELPDDRCPYVGLEAFRRETYFFGRVADTHKLAEQVRKHPLTIVAGASGSGKSSLVMGGLLPTLKDAADTSGWLQLPPFTPGDDALGHAAAAFAGVLPGSAGMASRGARFLKENPEQFALSVISAAPHPLVVTIDQFEEVFTLSSGSERDALAQCLARLLSADKGHRVILTVREEFRPRMVVLTSLQPYIDSAWYDVPPMGYAELRQAIERPAAMVNLEFQSGIADDLAKKVLGQAAALPLLQFTLQRLWLARDRNRITREVYDRVGSPLEALKKTTDEFYAGLDPQTKAEVKRVLLELVRVDELLEAYRQPVHRSELLRAGKANTGDVLERLSRADYISITAGSDNADPVVEIKHESLIRNWPQLVGWIDEKRLERRRRVAIYEAAQRWSDTNRPVEGLLTSWQLDEAKKFADLSRVEQDFIAASAEAIDRAQYERERRVYLIALGAVVFAAVAVLVAVWYRNVSEDLKEERTLLEKKAGGLEARTVELEASESRLRKDLEQLKIEKDDIFRKYADLFAKDLNKSKELSAKSNTSQPVRIFLQIASEAQRGRATDIAAKLRASGFLVPKGIELVKASPSRSEVRYFRPEDQAGAQDIVRSLKNSLGVEDTDQPKLIKTREGTVPPRQYEVWFAPSAFAAKPEPPVATTSRSTTSAAAPSPPAPPGSVSTSPGPSTPAVPPVAPPPSAPPASQVSAPSPAVPVPSKRIVESRFLEKGHYAELPAVFGGKNLWIYVNRDVDRDEAPRVIIFDKAPAVDHTGPHTSGFFRRSFRRGTEKPLDSAVTPGKFSEPFTYGARKYRLIGEVLIGRGIQFEIVE